MELAEQLRVLAGRWKNEALGLTWEGPDAVKFLAMSEQCVRVAESVGSHIDAAAAMLTRNAAEQESVSGSLSSAWLEDVDKFVRQTLIGAFDGDDLPPRQFDAAAVRASVREAIAGTDLDRQDVIDALERAQPWELDVIASLREHGMDDSELVEFLKGGHVTLPKSDLYDVWAREAGVTDRSSSHYGGQAGEGSQQQHGHYGELFKEMLFGKNADGTTWVQLEARASDDAGHYVDWFEYQIDDNNQGPWGESPHTDQDPIVLRKPIRIDVRDRIDSDPSFA